MIELSIIKRKIMATIDFRRKFKYDKKISAYTVSFIIWIGVFVFIIVLTTINFSKVHYNNSIDFNNMQQQSITAVDNDPVASRKVRKGTVTSSSSKIQYDIVKDDDYIYKERIDLGWDSSPIVIEKYKLIFFTIPKVGCTVWKQLFRRMMNITDWDSQDWTLMLPHNPSYNGLKYLYNYTKEQASIMMTSPQWTRAMMVRDPKIRLLSSYIDKAVENNGRHISDRCCPDRSCTEKGSRDIEGFLQLIETCHDEHWRPQHDRIDTKYWPYMTHILHLENAYNDTKELLKSINNTWELYGNNGWGHSIGIDHNINTSSNIAIFESKSGGGEHTRNAYNQIWKYYTPEYEMKVENFYNNDYTNPKFHFQRGKCLTCITE